MKKVAIVLVWAFCEAFGPALQFSAEQQNIALWQWVGWVMWTGAYWGALGYLVFDTVRILRTK